MKTIKITLFLIITFFASNLYSQDLIIKNTKDTLKCKIKEVGSDEIKYSLPDYPEDVSFGIDKEDVWKIVFYNGKEMSFVKDLNNPKKYTNDNKNALKFYFFSPLMGNVAFAYERSVKPGQSFEFSLAYIYGRSNLGLNDKGAYVRAGYKFIKSPDFYVRKMKYSHILKGGYIKPEITFTAFHSKNDIFYSASSNVEKDVMALTLTINLGKQVVYSNAFLIDYFIGFGYGFVNEEIGYYYSSLIGANEFPISFSYGIKIGGLFGK